MQTYLSLKQEVIKVGRYSFNVKGGRCETCEGDGVITYEMHFLPDVFIPCDTCKGARYNRETLEIKFKNKNIADILDMTVDEGCDFFENIQSIRSKLITLKHVGLGYMRKLDNKLRLYQVGRHKELNWQKNCPKEQLAEHYTFLMNLQLVTLPRYKKIIGNFTSFRKYWKYRCCY